MPVVDQLVEVGGRTATGDDVAQRITQGLIRGHTLMAEGWCVQAVAWILDTDGLQRPFIALNEVDLIPFRGHLKIGAGEPLMRSPHAENPTALCARVSRGSG